MEPMPAAPDEKDPSVAIGFRRGRRWHLPVVAFALVAISAAAQAQGLIVFGVRQEGGGSNAFETVLDLASGHERTTVIHGLSSEQYGFDGRLWSFVNGATVTADMPAYVADRRAEMWIRQSGFRTFGYAGEVKRRVVPPKGSPVELIFDPRTRQVATATIEGDYGPVAFSFGDWRRVGSYDFPMRLAMSSSEGEQIDLVQSVRLIPNVHANLLARPSPSVVAHLAEASTTIFFKSVGARKTHILAPASINGTAVELIFDTGAANILTREDARRLGIASSGGVNIAGVGEGHDDGGYGQVDAVGMGAAALSDQSFLIIPSPFRDASGKPEPIAGTVGYEFLTHFVTTIDYRAQTLTFRKSAASDQKGIRLPFLIDGHSPVVAATVNGEPAMLRLDTGDGGTVTFFPAYTKANALEAGKAAAEIAGGGAGGTVKATTGKVAHFNLGGIDFPNLPVQFSKNSRGAFASKYLAGNLGGGVLRCFRITFDYPHHQLWLEPQLNTPGCAATAKAAASAT